MPSWKLAGVSRFSLSSNSEDSVMRLTSASSEEEDVSEDVSLASVVTLTRCEKEKKKCSAILCGDGNFIKLQFTQN